MTTTTPMEKQGKQNKSTKQTLPLETEELRLRQKCLELKKRIMITEAQNEIKAISISRSQTAFKRLQYEYSLLLEVLERKSLNLPISELKSLSASDLNGQNIESIDLNDIKSMLQSNDSLKMFESLEVFNRLKSNLMTQDQLQQNNNVQSNNTKKRPIQSQLASHANQPPSKKKTRDPREPKRPTNAYLYFCDAERENVKKDWATNRPNEQLEITKVMTEFWKKLTDDEKKPYYDMYEKDKLRYHKAIEEFNVMKDQEQRTQTPEIKVENDESMASSPAPIQPDSEPPISLPEIVKSDEQLSEQQQTQFAYPQL